MPLRICHDCLLGFIPRSKVSTRCKACQQKHRAALSLESARRRLKVQRHNEMSLMTEAEIDRVFTEALKEIRRKKADSLEPSRSYHWQYS